MIPLSQTAQVGPTKNGKKYRTKHLPACNLSDHLYFWFIIYLLGTFKVPVFIVGAFDLTKKR